MVKALFVSLLLFLISCSENKPKPTPPKPEREVKLHPHENAAIKRAYLGSGKEDQKKLKILLENPSSKWIGEWSGDVETTLRRHLDDSVKGYSVITVYNIPNRDCGNHSKGGHKTFESYKKWIDKVAKGIGTSPVIVILEPDAIPLYIKKDCMKKEMLSALSYAVTRLQSSTTMVYIDAGHPQFVRSIETLVKVLIDAGIRGAKGFALNVSNFHSDKANIRYGERLSILLKKSYVIDTSRNGNGSNGEWCNPTGRKIGKLPTLSPKEGKNLDAYLWIKVPGESDGRCNGGPVAGTFWKKYALGLIPNAH